jgi:hypothetical protein
MSNKKSIYPVKLYISNNFKLRCTPEITTSEIDDLEFYLCNLFSENYVFIHAKKNTPCFRFRFTNKDKISDFARNCQVQDIITTLKVLTTIKQLND